MKNPIYKIPGVIFVLFILNSSFFITNCMCQWVQNGIGLSIDVWALAHSGNNIFAGTISEFGGEFGVYSSTNNGTNWIQTSLNNQQVYSLTVNGNNIFAGTLVNGVYLSTNNGANWMQTSLNNRTVYSLVTTGNNVFAGTYQYGVFLSTNNGTNWTPTSLNNKNVRSLALNGNKIFAGTLYPDSGVYLSTNNGTSWTQTSLNNQSVPSLAVNGNNVFAGTENGVFLSTNNGTNWTQTSLNNKKVFSLSVNGNNSIVAGTFGNGVYVSNDTGTSWTQRNEGLGVLGVLSFYILNDYIFAGTLNGNIYRRLLDELVGIQSISSEIPQYFSLSQNYPNPFNPTTNLEFGISKLGFVSLKIYDMLGKEVAALVNSYLNAGTYNYQLSTDNYQLTSGVYFYKLTVDGNIIDTKRMVLLK